MNLESATGETPVHIIEFSKLLTCLGDPSKFRIVAKLHPAPDGIIENLEQLFEKAVYSKKINALIIRTQSTMIIIYASGIVTMTRLNSADHAREILTDVIGKINQSIKEANFKSLCAEGKSRKHPEPRKHPESRRHPDPMELNACLPRTNCAQCGVKSCFYFSTMLACFDSTLENCQLLREPRYTANREALERLMSYEYEQGPEVK